MKRAHCLCSKCAFEWLRGVSTLELLYSVFVVFYWLGVMLFSSTYDPHMPTDKAKLMVYMDPAYKHRLGQLAAAENRSMSNYVETLIIRAVENMTQDGRIEPGRRSVRGER